MEEKIVLASHGSMAEGILSAAKMIMGEDERVSAFGLDRYDTPQDISREAAKIVEAAEGAPVIILCDVKGGSVYNELLHLCEKPNVSLITGMNLNLLLEILAAPPKMGLLEKQREAIEIAKQCICYFDIDVLAHMKAETEDGELW